MIWHIVLIDKTPNCINEHLVFRIKCSRNLLNPVTFIMYIHMYVTCTYVHTNTKYVQTVYKHYKKVHTCVYTYGHIHVIAKVLLGGL